MYRSKRLRDPNVVQPKILNLPNITTDDKGQITLDLKNYNLEFAGNDQVSLNFLEVPMVSLHNVGRQQKEEEAIRLCRHVDSSDTLPETVGGQTSICIYEIFTRSESTIIWSNQKFVET